MRITSDNLLPASFKILSIFLKMNLVCAPASPGETICPWESTAVVPATSIVLPIRTAREYPATDSQGASEEKFIL